MFASLGAVTLGIALFTLIETLIVIALVALVAGLMVPMLVKAQTTVKGSFVNPPTSVPPGGSADFTYKVTRSAFGIKSADSGRLVNFAVNPPAALTATPARKDTAADGTIVVTVSADPDYRGRGDITGIDADSGKRDDVPTYFNVP